MKTKVIAIMALAITALGSCKKDKEITPDTPEKTVKTGSVVLKNYNTEKDSKKAIVWFSISSKSAHPMEEISSKVALQKTIAFGYNLNEINWGLYSPITYPQAYGQEDWTVKNATIFKQMPIHADEFGKMIQESPELLDAAFVATMFDDGSSAEASVTNFSDGAIYVFQTSDGIQGILRIAQLAKTLDSVQLDVWVVE